ALINGFSEVPAHQKKMVYLCQLLIRIEKGKSLGNPFENDQGISPLESALSFWTLLEREEIKLEKLHEDIRRLIQIQIIAVHMEKGYFKEAAEVLERLFTDSEADKPLRTKLATVIKSKDPYVPLLQSFSYNLLISKIKSYIERFMTEKETNFLLQVCQHCFQNLHQGVTCVHKVYSCISRHGNYPGLSKKVKIVTLLCYVDVRMQTCCLNVDSSLVWMYIDCLLGLNSLQNVEKHADVSACGRRRQRWTYKEDLALKSGVKEFGVGNWAKILVHGDFNNRTSVMLKDRWRTLCRIN
ncbi:TERF1 factor, partial [Pedionomus torquatus]|nr:TERF1 factor [Pedionomus torquatus]